MKRRKRQRRAHLHRRTNHIGGRLPAKEFFGYFAPLALLQNSFVRSSFGRARSLCAFQCLFGIRCRGLSSFVRPSVRSLIRRSLACSADDESARIRNAPSTRSNPFCDSLANVSPLPFSQESPLTNICTAREPAAPVSLLLLSRSPFATTTKNAHHNESEHNKQKLKQSIKRATTTKARN